MSYHSRTNLASKLFLGTCISAAALSCNSENLFGIHSRTDVKSIRWFPDSVVEAGEQVTARIFMTAYAANVRVQVVQKGTPLSERPQHWRCPWLRSCRYFFTGCFTNSPGGETGV